MISAGLEGRLPYMTYPEPWRGQPKQPPEFLRPAPKPVPPTSRYNGINTSPNCTRLPPSQRTISKYPSPTPITPVNLAQHKDEIAEDLPYNHYRLFPASSHFPHHFPPAFTTTLYQNHYSHMMRPTFATTPLPPLETYSPTTPTSITTATFLTPSATFNPPSPIKSGQNLLRDKRNNSTSQSTPTSTQTQIQQQQQQHVAFKVPSGKEGSLKHRILIRPEDGHRNNSTPLDLQQKFSDITRKRLTATMSPPRSPKKSAINNNNTILENFAKGSLIQLANGELRKIEDMRTEDFVSSAENSPELRLAESTVVRIEEHYNTGTATISLTYNQRRTQVNVESNVEHPFFVFGKGWSSCSPERTQKCYRLKVHQLQVGDILISLTPREQFALPSPPISSSPVITSRSTSTIMTTATSTAMTIRQMSIDSIPKSYHEIDHQSSNLNNNNNSQMQPINLHTPTYAPSISPDSLAASRKRRWSAPDQICDDEDQHQLQHPSRKLKVE